MRLVVRVARHVNSKEAALAGHAGDNGLALALLGVLGNDGAGIGRRVGVFDHERDARLAHGEDGLLVQDGSAHIGKLTQLLVGDARDGLSVGHDARVG